MVFFTAGVGRSLAQLLQQLGRSALHGEVLVWCSWGEGAINNSCFQEQLGWTRGTQSSERDGHMAPGSTQIPQDGHTIPGWTHDPRMDTLLQDRDDHPDGKNPSSLLRLCFQPQDKGNFPLSITSLCTPHSRAALGDQGGGLPEPQGFAGFPRKSLSTHKSLVAEIKSKYICCCPL